MLQPKRLAVCFIAAFWSYKSDVEVHSSNGKRERTLGFKIVLEVFMENLIAVSDKPHLTSSSQHTRYMSQKQRYTEKKQKIHHPLLPAQVAKACSTGYRMFRLEGTWEDAPQLSDASANPSPSHLLPPSATPRQAPAVRAEVVEHPLLLTGQLWVTDHGLGEQMHLCTPSSFDLSLNIGEYRG